MSSLSMIGSLAGVPLAQTKGSEVDRAKTDAAHQQRSTEAAQRADAAAGIGTTQEDSQTSERDADGRRLWEQQAEVSSQESALAPETLIPPVAKDHTGERGGQLDLTG